MQPLGATHSADRPYSPAALFDDSYREIVRGEFDQSQRAWLRILSEMQQTNARWCARRQEMIRESADVWMDPRAVQQPGALAIAWRRWATASATRWVEDVADQLEFGMKAAMCLNDIATPQTEERAPSATKPKRAKARARNGAAESDARH